MRPTWTSTGAASDRGGLLDVVRAHHPGGDVHRLPGVDVAVFTDGPERDVFNNAVLAHGLGAQARRDAVDAMVTTYADAGITSYAAWVHETDPAMLAELTGRGFVHQETTWAMAGRSPPRPGRPAPASHASARPPRTCRPHLRAHLRPRSSSLPRLARPRAEPPADFHLALGRLEGDPSPPAWRSTTTGDCRHLQRRHAGARAATRTGPASSASCSTTPWRAVAPPPPCSPPDGAGVYAGQGFRDLGRILEFGPR